MMEFYVLTWYKKSARSIIGFQCPAVILLEPRLVIYSWTGGAVSAGRAN